MMTSLLGNLKLNVKVALLGAGSVLITAIALVVLAVWQSSQYNTLAQCEVDELIDADLDHITQGIYSLVQTENETVQQQVDYNLNVAKHVLANVGAVRLSTETVTWSAISPFTNQSVMIQVPKMLIGGQWPGQNTNPNVETPVVDEVTRLVGETATILQRMNENGDMLRVATTVMNTDGQRAIGTYIPALNPDGSSNPVIDAVLQGKTYHGRAFVINEWYLTAYAPIKDGVGKIVGMLYVGVKQKSIESRVRQAVLKTKVGKTGYVYILGGKGDLRGHYVISKDGQRDGEDIWESKDAGGRYFIQSIVEKALALKPGELATERYPWQNPGETTHRWKIARLAYYEPWDWVIGTSVYEDEVQTYRAVLEAGRTRMMGIMGLAGLALTLFIGMFGILVAWTITRPIRELTKAVETIIQGDLKQRVNIHSSDEIGALARTFNLMTGRLQQTMEGLRKSEEFLSRVIENIPDMIIVKDAETLRFVRFNKAGEDLLGYSRKELLGKNVNNFFPKEEADSFTAKDKDVLRNKSFLDIPEEIIQTRHLGKKILHTKKIPILDNEGNVQYLLGISEDITERKRVEKELIQYRDHLEDLVEERTAQLAVAKKQAESANLAKSAFLAKMSHELRTPLNAILGYTQIFLRRPLDPDILKGLNIIQQSGEHLLTLINDILNLSKIEAGKMELHTTTIFFRAFLEGLAGVIRSRAEAKGLVFSFEAPDNLPAGIHVDETRMRQVLLNLLDNAVKFTEKGCVKLRVLRPAADQPTKSQGTTSQALIRFEVEDTGMGIASDQLDRIFLPFEQASQVPGANEGTGLGLAISRQLVQLMGSDLRVTSELGRGSLFWFEVTLPIVEVATEAAHPPGRVITGYQGRRLKVLVVDDILSNRAVLVDLLQPIGFEVIEATDGQQAVLLAQEKRPDLILMDRYMPVMNGHTSTSLIREISDLRNVVILAISASVSKEDELRSREIGFDDFLPKPINWPTLAAVMEKHLKLEWKYEDKTGEAARGGTPTESLTPPPKEELVILLDLAMMGDLWAIMKRAKHIKTLDEKYASYANQLSELAGNFEEGKILELIKRSMKEES
jgi:PAS domain S-box-containing protein